MNSSILATTCSEDEYYDAFEGSCKSAINDPSRKTLNILRWSYFAIAIIVFIFGALNIVYFLIIKEKWRTTPILMLYICG